MHRRSQDFQRVGALRVDPGFLVGEDGEAEGGRREAPERRGKWSLGRGAVSPSTVLGCGGIAPEIF